MNLIQLNETNLHKHIQNYRFFYNLDQNLLKKNQLSKTSFTENVEKIQEISFIKLFQFKIQTTTNSELLIKNRNTSATKLKK